MNDEIIALWKTGRGIMGTNDNENDERIITEEENFVEVAEVFGSRTIRLTAVQILWRKEQHV